ncbi:hypothetical protein JKF63_07752 [Porcisia hertigi]|uniref:Transmembrane protein n=1 Tax=Porcisia hertigi TaxID=2761500 RepID=A0A836LLT0_9TRYP|nr:hypothetical protein JKF63_07752 [Porcisia hertigi]
MSPIHKKDVDVLDLGAGDTAGGQNNSHHQAGAPSWEEQSLPLKSSPTTNAPMAAANPSATKDLRHCTHSCEEDVRNATPVSASTASSSLRYTATTEFRIPSPLENMLTSVVPCPRPGTAKKEMAATRTTARATAPDTDHNADTISFASTVNPAPSSPVVEVEPTKHVADVIRSLPSRAVSIVMAFLCALLEKLREMSLKQFLWVAVLVTLVMVGNFLQIVMLNFWLFSFPSDGTPGNYTAFAVPGIFFSLLFMLLLGGYTAIWRPSLRFARHAHGWVILLGVGFCDAINSWMATYAASYTSEVLQALFTNFCPLYAVFLCKWILRDTRHYANAHITSVFVLTIGGILAASLYGLVKDKHISEGNWWILIFFLSMPLRVLMNVWQSLYMIVYTRDPKFVLWLSVRLGTSEEAPKAFAAENNHDGTPDTFDTLSRTDVDVIADHTTFLGSGLDKITPAIKRYGGRMPMGRLEHGEVGEEEVVVVVDDNADPARHDSVGTTGDTVGDIAAEACAAVPNDEPMVDLVNSEDAVYSTHFTRENEDLRATATPASRLPTQTMFTVRYNQSEDTIVKLVMLAGETTIQMCFTLFLLPADALPWWGNSDSVRSTWSNFVEGLGCVFTIQENFFYCFLYTLGFVFTYIGCAYLNHYSAALCSIVSQLSSPVTALILVIVPSWNVHPNGESPWYLNLIAILFLCVAALIYVVWEEKTDDEKVHAEYELKMSELHVRPSSHQAPHRITIQG